MSDVAPITLITGTPGMGKTALLVDMLDKLKGTRPLYVMGVPELAIPHEPLPPIAEWTEVRRDDPVNPDLEMHYFTFPPNSLVVVDEAQRVWRPRSSASKVPPHVAAFETVRHTGVEFILLTQSPKLLDSNIRELVGRHIAIGRRMLGRYLWEWPKVGDIDSRMSRDEASKRRYSPPSRVFKLYKSAETHIPVKRRLNQVFVYLGLALAFFGYMLYSSYQVFDRNTKGSVSSAEKEALRADAVPRAFAGQVVAGLPSVDDPAAFVPVNPDLPASAPAYSGLAPVVAAPRIDACISSRSRCLCYSQQGTRLAVSDAKCRNIASGLEFDPYRQQVGTPMAPVASAPRSSSAPVPDERASLVDQGGFDPSTMQLGRTL